MLVCLQRVSRAAVRVQNETVGQIGTGLVVLVGVAADDDQTDVRWMAEKLAGLRIFSDGEGKMNASVLDVAGSALVISQFTLLGDCRKGRRPSFDAAAPPEKAEELYEQLIATLRSAGVPVATGRFRQEMQVELVNDGPVTLIVDSAERRNRQAAGNVPIT